MFEMNVLITGVAGFIGSNLADRLLLLNNCKVIGIDNLVYGVREQVPEAVEFHRLDIRSKDIRPLFENVDYVFHLAAKNCISDCQSDPVETADVNITGAVNVFEAARRAGVKKVIYAESSALYEGSVIFPTPESQVKPESFYAASKAASMYFANSFRRFSDLRFTALRYFCVYGPRQDYRRTIPPVMSAFIIKLLKGEHPIIYGTGDKRRDFVYVDDVNDFHLLCINDGRTDGGAFNIGSGKNYSVNEICEMIARIVGVHIPPVRKPDLPGEAEQTLADITNARRLGWSPKTLIVDGLEKMVDFIKNEFRKGNIK
jgi:nucleoside-diphosphate-sugar epimerase